VTWQSSPLVAVFVSVGVASAITLAYLATIFVPEQYMVTPNREFAEAVTDASIPLNADPLAAERGRAYYTQLCMSCHGPRGDGQGEWAYRVTPRPANLTNARARGRSDRELLSVITDGIPGTPMIGWKKQLTEAQRQQLVGYVRSLGASAQTKHSGASS
jgi:mono/diheme cytochrome c family protein